MSSLKELTSELADRAEAQGIVPNHSLGFVMANCQYRPGSEFYICFLLDCELADRAARREGYAGSVDRAFTKAKEKLS